MSVSLRQSELLPARLVCPWDSPDKNTGVHCHALFQGTSRAQGLNLCLLCLLHWQAGSLPLVPPGKKTNSLYSFPITFIQSAVNILDPSEKFPSYILYVPLLQYSYIPSCEGINTSTCHKNFYTHMHTYTYTFILSVGSCTSLYFICDLLTF